MSLRKLFSVSTSLLLVAVLFTGSAAAVGPWTPVGVGEQCTAPASVDGNYIAISDQDTGNLYYHDIAANETTDTGITETDDPSVKDGLIAYYHGPNSSQKSISIYDISKDKIIDTRVTTARPPYNSDMRHGGRYFNGDYIAYIDDVDGNLKLYQVKGKKIIDTGVSNIWIHADGPVIDGNIVVFDGWNELWDGVFFYDIANETVTAIEPGQSPVVSGNIISYIDGDDWVGNLKYYEIDTGLITDTGLSDVVAQSIDGGKIVANTDGDSIVVYDVASGQIQDTGLHGCGQSDTCWIDIDGDIIIHERWEGGTRAKDEAGAWYEVYPAYDYNGDGSIRGDCVAGYADLSL